MRTAAIIASGASLLSVASARIYGFAVPATVAPNSVVKLEIIGQNYIQSIQDVAFSFGISPTPIPQSLGTLLDSKFLGPDDSNVAGNITHYVHIPSTFPKGKATFSGALFSLIGAAYSPSDSFFAVNITVGDYTSPNYVESSPA